MAELKPCQWCGGDGGINIIFKEKIVFCGCWDCGTKGTVVSISNQPTEKELAEAITKAIEAWNRRVENERK